MTSDTQETKIEEPAATATDKANSKEDAKKDEEAETNETKEAETSGAKKEGPEVSEDVVNAVAERLRFFFSDANVRQDLFVRKFLTDPHGEYPHSVTVEVLLRFNTIKQHTTDPAVVIAAAKSIPEKLTVSEDGKAIGRVEAFTKEKMDENVSLTLLIDNLPLAKGKDDAYAVSSKEIRNIFHEYGPVAIVKLRFKAEDCDDDDDIHPGRKRRRSAKHARKIAMGSALVEFEAKESLEKAAEDVLTSKSGEKVEPKRKLEIGGNEVQVFTLKDYIDAAPKKRDKVQKENDQSGGKKGEAEEKAKSFTFDWKKGCVIKLKGLDSKCDREAILDAAAKGLDISLDGVKERKIYADFSRGQVDGAIRFVGPEDVDVLCKKLASGELEIAGAKVGEATILEGGDEEKYWNDFIEFKNKQMHHRADERSSRNKRQRRSY